MVHGAGLERCGGYTRDCKARRSERQLCQAFDSARVARAGDRRSDLCRFPTSGSHCRRTDALLSITHHLGQPAAGAGHRFRQPFELDPLRNQSHRANPEVPLMIRYWAGVSFFAVTPSDQPTERNPRNRADMAWCWHSPVSLVAEMSPHTRGFHANLRRTPET